MTLVKPATHLQGGGDYSARAERLHSAAGIASEHNRHTVSARQGVIPAGENRSFKITARPTADMWVRAAAGRAWVNVASVVGGIVACTNDGDYDIPLVASHPSLNRRDLIALRVYDSIDSIDTTTDWDIIAIPGTPAVSPTAPAAGPSMLPLATALIPAGSNSVGEIVDMRPLTVGAGGILPSNGAPSSTHTGQGIFRTDLNALQVVGNDGRARRVFDDGLTFGYGVLGAAHTYQGYPGAQLAMVDINNAAANMPGMSTTFTWPTNVPTTRRLVVLTQVEMRATRCGAVWIKHMIDGGEIDSRFQRCMAVPRTLKNWGGDLEVDPTRHYLYTVASIYNPPTAGQHTITTRAAPEASAGSANPLLEFTVGEMSVWVA
ncbi:hypothetical protein GCM10022221_68660 [Actinocorallia aurea]